MLVGYRAGAGSEGMYEYEPPNGDDSEIATGLPDACLVSDPPSSSASLTPTIPTRTPHGLPIKTLARPHSLSRRIPDQPEHRSFVATIPHPGYWCCVSFAIPRGSFTSTASHLLRP